MRKRNKTGIVLLTAGAVLVIAALLLFSHNRMEDYRAGKQAEETLRAVEAAMDARGANVCLLYTLTLPTICSV